MKTVLITQLNNQSTEKHLSFLNSPHPLKHMEITKIIAITRASNQEILLILWLQWMIRDIQNISI